MFHDNLHNNLLCYKVLYQLKKLYDDPIITLEKADNQHYLCICYPTNKIKLLLIPRHIYNYFYKPSMKMFHKFIIEKKYTYPNQIKVDIVITIRINKIHKITCLDQLIEVLTQYYNICKKNEEWLQKRH